MSARKKWVAARVQIRQKLGATWLPGVGARSPDLRRRPRQEQRKQRDYGPGPSIMTSASDLRLKFYLILWYGVMFVGLLFLSLLLPGEPMMVAVLFAGFGWLVTIPYHSQIAFLVAITTFSSALVVPFLPGDPFLWEAAALLAWTGVMVNMFLRRYPVDFRETIRQNRWIFRAAVMYCLVLVVTMFVRGVGLRIMGSTQAGGRYYFQQLACAIFPLLFCMIDPDERTVVRLLTLQWILAATYLISDFVLALGVGQALLNFFALSNDAQFFEFQASRFGVRRFQSFAFASQGALFLLLMRVSLSDFLGRKAVWLVPLFGGIVGLGLLSGHRFIVAIGVMVLAFCSLAQRFLTRRNVAIGLAVVIPVLALAYGTARYLPSSAQRAISFLPGIEIESLAAADAASTLSARKNMFRLGMELIPEYFWVGRGFTRYMDEYSMTYDPTGTTFLLNQGAFYNGFIGLMVNTGFFGMLSMSLFLLAGTVLALRIIRYVRRWGCNDNFVRGSCVLASLWLANVIAFYLLHGDAEYAMKNFSLQAGMLIVCYRLLRKRLAVEPAGETSAAAAGSG